MYSSSAHTIDSGNAKLSAARKKVERAWFPVNPKLLDRLQEGLDDGAYDLDLDFLISEIKNDVALYLYCIKECRKALLKDLGKDEPLPNLEPHKLFHKAGLNVLRAILVQPVEKFSEHQFTETSKLQLKRLREAMISASCAEVLADERDLSSNLCYSTSMLRELGLTLIAWNYPETYEHAVASLLKGSELDQELTRLLGFSPTLLAINLAKDWGLPHEIRAAIGDDSALKEVPESRRQSLQQTVASLEKICEVGQALARASHPEVYPTARADWNFAQKEIERSVGLDTFKKIQTKVKENCVSYCEVASEIFQKNSSFDPERSIEESLVTEGFRGNRYARVMPEPTRGYLIEIYRQVSATPKILEELVLDLTKRIIPEAGFQGGCIFLLEPSSMMLSPRLKIAESNLSEFRSYHALSMNTQTSNPVVAAYHCNTPIVESDMALSLNAHSCIAGILGIKQRIGVLYLEPSSQLLSMRDDSILSRFKALSITLQDILHVS